MLFLIFLIRDIKFQSNIEHSNFLIVISRIKRH